LARHPWEITLREFVKKVHRDYGIELELATAAVVSGWILRKEDRIYPVPVMDPDEVMPLPLLRALSKFYRLPPEDSGLDPYDEEDDD
jgi:hypothetical protein